MVNRKTLRRTLLWAAVAGVIGLGVAIALGQPVAGLLGLLGLALGAANARAAQVSVARYSDRGEFSKGRFAISVLGRLGVITVIALGCAVLLRPTGLAVFAGLAVFQLLTIVSAMLPLVKEIRQS
ncbi:hypothetical protein GCM10023321_35870 [Pseudonocardia eucalypti]|uniref:ATP synthase subunit I n=2 Tax=Pseudonocardia eucalypti TaxID=648755 RepID=A0ABP9Q921_9PSEU